MVDRRRAMSKPLPEDDFSSDSVATTESDRREPGEDRRKTVVDRRSGLDRRVQTSAESGYKGPERRVAERRMAGQTGPGRRRGPGRRLSDTRRSAEEGEMTGEQFEF